jgi:hypothetical protein
MTLAAVLAAILAGLVGGIATLVAAKIDVWPHVLAAAALGGPLIAAVVFAVQAARPTSFSFAGNNPKRWASVVGDGENLIRALAVQASYYAKGIQANGEQLKANHKCLWRSLNWVLTGVIAGIATELVIIMAIIAERGL